MRHISRHTAERLMAEGADVSITKDPAGWTDYHVRDVELGPDGCGNCVHYYPDHEDLFTYVCGKGKGFHERFAPLDCWEKR